MNIFLTLNKSYIDGRFVEGDSGEVFQSLNPFDDSLVAEIPLASLEQTNKAFEVADNSEWKHNPKQRKKVLKNLIKLFIQHRKNIVDVLIKESGSTFVKANAEYVATINILRESLKLVEKIGHVGNRSSLIPGKKNLIYRSPKGIVTSVAPFNFPLHLSMRTIAPALALGNAVVHKPDVQTGIVSGAIPAVLLREAGVPSNVFQMVLTEPKLVGEVFFTHEKINAISFTGSTAVGKHIRKVTNDRFISTALELGGNSPFIVMDDANLDHAVRALIPGKFLHSGQICMSVNRIIVHESVYEEFIDKFKAATENLKMSVEHNKVGIIGPIINKTQLEKTKKFIEMAKASGEMVLEGEVSGNFVTPFIFKDIKNDSEIAQTELFSPIALIIKARSNDEAIRFANDTDYGLSAAIFTEDVEKGQMYAEQIESGMVHVNEQTVLDFPNIPFGGVKNSGMGRYGNPYVLEDFTDLKWMSTQRGPLPYPFN